VKVLNLGCGNKLIVAKPGEIVVNHDRMKHRPEVNVAHDLNLLPWPWRDNTFSLVHACSVLEHLRIPLVDSMGECWRILAPGGHLRVKVPYWNSDAAHSDPTHYWTFSPHVFEYFDPSAKRGQQYGFYEGVRPWFIAHPPTINRARTSIITVLEVRK